MKLLRNVKLCSVIVGIIIGSMVFYGLIIKTHPDLDAISMWIFWAVTMLIATGFYCRKEINIIIDKWGKS